MLESIVSHGLALGAVYGADRHRLQRHVRRLARVQFHGGRWGCSVAVFGALFINKMGMPVFVGFILRSRRAPCWA